MKPMKSDYDRDARRDFHDTMLLPRAARGDSFNQLNSAPSVEKWRNAHASRYCEFCGALCPTCGRHKDR